MGSKQGSGPDVQLGALGTAKMNLTPPPTRPSTPSFRCTRTMYRTNRKQDIPPTHSANDLLLVCERAESCNFPALV
jgi:hypothetical protein